METHKFKVQSSSSAISVSQDRTTAIAVMRVVVVHVGLMVVVPMVMVVVTMVMVVAVHQMLPVIVNHVGIMPEVSSRPIMAVPSFLQGKNIYMQLPA